MIQIDNQLLLQLIRDQSADVALQVIIKVVTVLTDKPRVDQSIQPCLLKNSPSFYTAPTPKGWREAEKVIVLIDWEMIPLQ